MPICRGRLFSCTIFENVFELCTFLVFLKISLDGMVGGYIIMEGKDVFIPEMG